MTENETGREALEAIQISQVRALCDRDGIGKLAKRWRMNERTLGLATTGKKINAGTRLQIAEGLKREAK